MAIKSVLAVVALCLCVHFSFADNYKMLKPEETDEYSVMCPKTTGWSSAPMPPDYCKMEDYLSCGHGVAEAIVQCPSPQVFDRVKLWCVTPDANTTWPPNCPPPTQQPNTIARTCADLKVQPGKIPVEGTCKNYTHCDQTGAKVMPCPVPSFFYLKECVYLPPYSYALPAEFIAECNRKDPYKL